MRSVLLLLLFTIAFGKASFTQGLNLEWGKQAGNVGWDYPSCLQMTGNDYLVGGSVKGLNSGDSLRPGLENSGNAWIGMYDSSGNQLWQKTFGSELFDNTCSISVLSSGILVSGIFQDTLSLDDYQVVADAHTSGYYALLDEEGNPSWLLKSGSNAIVRNLLNSCNKQGQVYLAGEFQDSLIIGNETRASARDKGCYLNHVSLDGVEQNLAIVKCTGTFNLSGLLTTDSLLYLTGNYSDSLLVADTVIISGGENDIFFIIFNPDGTCKSVCSFGGNGNDQVFGAVMNSKGEIGLTGSFERSCQFGTQVLQSTGCKDIFIVVLDSTNNPGWLKSLGNVADDIGYSITTNDEGEFYVAGSYVFSIQIPDESGNLIDLESTSDMGNSFVVKYDERGFLKAYYNLPGTSEEYCRAILADNSNNIVCSGGFYGSLLLNSSNQVPDLISLGEKDIYLVKIHDFCKEFNIDVQHDTLLCPGQCIILESPGEYFTYQWSPGGQLNSNLEICNSGKYLVTVTNQYGCVARDSLEVNLENLPVVNAGMDTIVEAGLPVALVSASAENVTLAYWETSGTGLFNNQGDINPIYSLSTPDINSGSVTLTLTGENSCGSSQSEVVLTVANGLENIVVFPNPTVGVVHFVSQNGLVFNSVTVLTQSGSVVQSNISINNIYFELDLTTFPPDTYYFYFNTNNGLKSILVNKL